MAIASLHKLKAMKSLFQKLYIDSFKGLSKETWLLAVVMLINRSGMMVVPFLSLYLLDELTWTKTQAGIATSCYGLAGLFGSFIGGWLSDKIGTQRVMLIALLWSGVCFFVFPFVTSFYGLCAWILCSVTIADMSRPAVFTAVSEYSNDENVTRGISLIRMAINLGISVGPAVGGFIAYQYGYFYLFIIDGATCVLAGLFLWKTIPIPSLKSKITEAKTRIKTRSPYLDGPFVLFLILNLICLTSFFEILYATPVFFKEAYDVSEQGIGWFFTANGLIIFIFEMPIIYFLEKKGYDFGPLALGALMIGMSYFIFSFFPFPMAAIIIHSLLIGFGEIINFPFISAIGLKRADEHSKGRYMGAISVLFSIGLVISPLVGLPLAEMLGYSTYWIVISTMCFISGIGIWWSKSFLTK